MTFERPLLDMSWSRRNGAENFLLCPINGNVFRKGSERPGMSSDVDEQNYSEFVDWKQAFDHGASMSGFLFGPWA
jgi:hypothetical protein